MKQYIVDMNSKNAYSELCVAAAIKKIERTNTLFTRGFLTPKQYFKKITEIIQEQENKI